MAKHHAIAATSQALVNLLTSAIPQGANDVLHDLKIALLPLTDGTTLIKGLLVCLYRLAPNTSRRYPPARPAPDGTLRRPPIGVDLYYALIPVGNGSDIQQRILGWAIRTLEDMTIVPPALLNKEASGTFADDESVELVLEGLSLPDLSTLWENVKPPPILMANYIARAVYLESNISVIQAGDVQTREFELRQIQT